MGHYASQLAVDYMQAYYKVSNLLHQCGIHTEFAT